MANVGALRTTISLDSAQFTQSMAGVNRQLKSLQQEQKAVTSSGTGFARGVDELRKKSDVLSRTLQLQQAKVNELRRRYEDSRKATGENSKETQKAMTAYQKATAEMNKTENALKGINEELNRQTNPWLQLEQNMTNAGEKLTSTGEKMTTFGRNMSMRVTAPILGLGGAMLRTGMEFESSMSNVQAISGATGSDLEKLEGRARELGATTSKSSSEAADALGYMALAGWDTTQMMEGLEPVLRLSEAGNIDLARASDLVTDSMSALQIEVKDLPQYLDNVAEASRSSNTSIDQLMQAYVTAGGNLAQFNVPLDESTALLGLLANRGLKGSEAGRALNAIMVNLTSGAGQAGAALEELEISAFDADGQFIGLEETLRLVKDRTKDMTDEQKAQYISMIAGKEHLKSFQGLLAGLDDEYGELKDSVSDADGALDNMAKTMQDNAQGNIERLKSSFGELSIQFSEHVLPVFTRGVEKVTELVDWFGSLDKSTQDNIIKMGAFAAAIGPVSLMLGGITKTAGGTVTVLGRLAGVIGRSGGGGATGGVAGKATLAGGLGLLGASGGPVALATLAIAGLTAGGIALHNHMKKDVIPEIDLFGDSVSESTQKAVGGFMELNDQATGQLNELVWGGKEITEEMAESLTGNFEQMGDQIVEGLEKHKQEGIATLENLFAESETLSAESNANLLNDIINSYDERIKVEEERTARMIEIVQTEKDENGKINKEANEELQRLLNERKNDAIEILSENEEEQRIILERMKDQADDIGKRQMADTIKNSIDTKDAVIAEAEEQYYSEKLILEKAKENLPPERRKMVDELIKEAERQKDETIKNAEAMHQSVIDTAKEQNPKLLEQIDITTGKVLSRWERLAYDSGVEFAKIYTKGKEVYENVKEVFKKAITMPSPNLGDTASLINDARKAWNKVSNIFTKKITMPAPSAREPNLQHKQYPNHYNGTDHFEGGLTWIGEKGFELARYGDNWGLYDFGLANLPRGTQIFTHEESKKILNSLNNIPAYAGGISPSGEADRIASRLSQPQQVQGEAVIYTTVINQMDGREIGRHTYKSVTEFQERDQKIKELFGGGSA
ncbi:phage tail tape measure protein [Gracilibacillus sp. HCP3S3_G5_1]|uniref:phage tail tape measure protein n=1 Tax=unclassified Gracilibacillus TaxID=2625209 RepID=UPI003F8BBE3E